MKVHKKILAASIIVITSVTPAAPQSGKPAISDRKLASDGITSGWLLEYPWPDATEHSQSWRTIPATLVLARHGHIIHRIAGDSTFWNWSFWHGGAEVAYQTGPMHGESQCVLASVTTGRVLRRWPGDCGDAPSSAPAWVRAAMGDR